MFCGMFPFCFDSIGFDHALHLARFYWNAILLSFSEHPEPCQERVVVVVVRRCFICFVRLSVRILGVEKFEIHYVSM